MSAAPSTAEQFEKVKTIIFPSAAEAAATLAAEVRTLIEERAKENRRTVLGLATGSTPVPFYRELVRLHREEGLSFDNVVTFNLDEYYGLDRTTARATSASCRSSCSLTSTSARRIFTCRTARCRWTKCSITARPTKTPSKRRAASICKSSASVARAISDSTNPDPRAIP